MIRWFIGVNVLPMNTSNSPRSRVGLHGVVHVFVPLWRILGLQHIARYQEVAERFNQFTTHRTGRVGHLPLEVNGCRVTAVMS